MLKMKLKELFFSYYPPTEADFSEWWKTGLFVFDANALLDLYGLQDDTRQELFAFLESAPIKERIWVPHQAAFEFSKNRVKVIGHQVNKYKSVIGRLEKLIPSMKYNVEEAQKEFAEPNLPETVKEVALQVSANFETLRSKISESVEPLEAEIRKLIEQLEAERDKQAGLVEIDHISHRLMTLLDENVGEPYDKPTLAVIYAEGAARYDADPQIPPGFSDKNDKDKKGNEIYGDLLVWKQTIEKAKMGKHPVLMVTNEQKPDWVEQSNKKKPRKELIQEMYQEAKVPFYLYSLTQFMESAKKYLEASFSSDSLSDASRVEEEIFKQTASGMVTSGTGNGAFEFHMIWERVEELLTETLNAFGIDANQYQFPQVLDLLMTNAIIQPQHHNRLHWINRLRNNIVNNTGVRVPKNVVRAAVIEMREMMNDLEDMSNMGFEDAVAPVAQFLSRIYPHATVSTQRDRPHIFLQEGTKHIAVDVVFINGINGDAISTLNNALNIGDSLVAAGNVDRFALVVVGKDQETAIKSVVSRSQNYLTTHKDIWVGHLESQQFKPLTNNHLIDPLFA